MFQQTFLAPQTRARGPFLMAGSLTIQSCIVVALVAIPLLKPRMLTPEDMRMRPPQPYFTKVTLAPPTAVAPTSQTMATVTRAFRQFVQPLVGPTSVPKSIGKFEDAPEFHTGVPAGIGQQGIGETFSALIGIPSAEATRTEPVNVRTDPPARVPAAPITVGGGVQAAKLITGPRPPYPPLAKAARVQGTVRLRAFIAPDGTIKNLQLISGPPLLVKAAYDAVAQWRYQPTLLNGSPVEVLTEVDVNFTLAQ